MRKICFDDTTVNEIRDYISSGHTMEETCNRFTLRYDTLRRVMFENGIKPFFTNKVCNKKCVIDEALTEKICSLFTNSNIRMKDICSELKVPDYVVQKVIRENFTEAEINRKHAICYRNSKLGNRNPMKGFTGEHHFNYKGYVEAGQGYLMMLKPDWYTGRKRSEYVFVHNVVMCYELGMSEIPKGFVVHHIDLNKKNNDPSNLALMSCSAHSKLHAIQNKLSKVQRLSVQE